MRIKPVVQRLESQRATWLGTSLIFLLAANSVSVAQPSFTEIATPFIPLTRSAVAWGDYDGDGRLDLALGGTAGTGIVTRLYHNDGNWSFTETTNEFPGVDLGGLAWGDYDRDGDLDLLLAGGTTDTNSYYVRITALYRNDGAGQFTRVTLPAPDVAVASLAWGDFDNDGDLDILLMGLDPNLEYRTVVCRNLGGDAFALVPTPSLPGLYNGSATWGDYDNDGDLDILLTGYSPAAGWVAKIFRNDGTNGFGDSGAILSGSGAVWEDYDRDGDLDVICGGAYFRNNGNNVFTNLAAGLGGPVAAGDFDNDGDLDIFSGRTLFQNNGSGGFSALLVLGPTNASAAAWADLDSDGDLDLIVTGSDEPFAEYRTRVFRNNLTLSNTPPTAPTGLTRTLLPDNNVALAWTAATDSQTAQALTYNLRVGTNSGGSQIVAPHATPDGRRSIVQTGVAHTNRWRLNDLPRGTYYWSVQAIDTAFAGSPFAAEATFTITNARPVISAVAAQVTFPNLAVSNIAFTVGDFETPAAALAVSAASGNTNLLPAANLILGGSASNRTVTLTPAGNRSGEAVVTLTVTDAAGLSASTSFILRVDAFTSLASVFPPVPTNRLTSSAACLAWLDHDLDGDLDLLFTHETLDTNFYDETLILRNDGGGVFTPVEVGLSNVYAGNVALGDVDGDGRLDLLLIGGLRTNGAWINVTRLYRNDGSGGFALIPVPLPQLTAGAVSIADVNGDGFADLFVAGKLVEPYDTDITKIFIGDGHGAFSEWPNDLPTLGTYSSQCYWGDVDNDGDNDLLLPNGYLFRNDGGGKFTDISSRVPPPPWGSVSVNWADLDNDGDLDILVAGTTNVICRNNGDGTFAYLASGITNIYYGTSVVLADYNNDGWVDVVLSPNGGSLFRNNGNLTFTLAETNLPPGIWGDYNNDGDLDMLAGGVIYRNNGAMFNTPPAAPTGLIATPQPGSSIVLSWARPTDAQTTNANGLHYNLRVGTSPGGIDVVSPLADATNGLRRLVQRGNAGSTNRWRLRDLPRGTYYWSVQAIDGAFAGSPFATNGTFTDTRPVISAIPDQVVAPGFLPPPIPFTVYDGETAASNLTLTASSADTNFVALANIVFGGAGTNRTVTVTPTPNQRGTNLITITVTDGNGFTDSSSFKFIVTPFLPLGALSVGTASRVYPADYNNDGLMDILVAGNPLQLWRSLGGGNFTNDATGLPASITGQAAWGDYDNDGYLDLAFADSTNVFHNDITNHFSAVPSGMTPIIYVNSAVSWGDYDGDGKLDLMRMAWGDLQLFRNMGDGTFVNSGVPLQWGQVGSMGWADLNNDGRLDLVVSGDFTGGGSYFTYIYRGDASGSLSLVVSNTLVGVRFSTVAFRDFDADGDLDILLAGDTPGAQTCRIYRNDGNFNFAFHGGLITSGTVRNATWGDYNNDGRPDVLAYGTQPTTVFVNDGSGNFTNLQANLPTVGPGGTAWADFNQDGDLDIIADQLFINLRPLTNQAPQAPAGLAATFASNVVALSWNAPADDSTSPSALTYSVRLGTNSGGSQILAADADPATGFRRLVPEVNTWPNRFRLVPGLRDGTYYWSVQAIDSGYAGSPFAAEASFTYFHPTISGVSNVTVYPGAPPPVVSFTVGDADSAADSLVLSAFSSNTNLLDATNIVFGGSGSNRTATLNLVPGATGTSIVAIVVTDLTGLTAARSFTVESSFFSDITPAFAGGNLFNAKWGDYDNDDDLDLFMAGSLYRNDGNLVFAKVTDLVAGARNAVAWGDYDRDGDLDLAIAADGFARVYRNDGNGAFSNVGAALMQGVSYPALAWGDYDNDGRLDLVLGGYLSGGGRTAILYHNNADGTFSAVPGAGLPGVDEAAFAWGDYDNDGKADLLIAGGIGPSTFLSEVYHNNGDGTFTAAGAGMIGIREGSVAWGDCDNDGDLDALVTGFCYGSYILNVYRNNGNGTFTDLNLGLQGTAFGEGQFVDFDNDGWLDIFVCGCIVNYCDASIARIYRNNRDGTFSDANAGLSIPANSAYPGSWGDFDRDGDLDLVLNRLYRNNCNVSNSPPAAPLNLVAELLPDNNVRLRWDAPADAQNTNAAGLNYAVRVGTNPGAADLVSPHANALSGFRRLPGRGPMNTNWMFLRDVPRGTFYWSAQAIDAGFAGSPFAPEGSFTITNARPLISAISNQFTVPGRTTPPISFTISDFETDATNLTLNAFSTNPAIVPNGNIVFGGAGSNRTVTLTTMPGASGTTTLTISVTDGGGLVAASRFDLVVQMFTDATAGLPAVTSSGASAWGDYDNDGDLDIALAGSGVNFTTVYRNLNGVFTNQNFNFQNPTANDLAWVDYDNDGDLDLTGSGWLLSGYAPTTFLFRNNFPSNTLTSLTIPAITNIADGVIAWGDYDNDGDIDLLLSGDPNTYHTPEAYLGLYRNDRGVFTNSGVTLPAVVKGAAVWGDYDNDGDLDLLLAGQTGSTAATAITKLFRNDGNGVFTEIATPLPGVTDCAVAFGDYNNDGWPDILLAGLGTNSVALTRIYRNLGNGAFTNSGANLTGVSLAAVAWGDADNDGYLDAVVSGSTNGFTFGALTKVYHNNGNGTFTDIGGALPGIATHNASWGDYDRDGDLDLLLGSRVYRNNWNIANTPPTAPTNLAFVILANNDVRLSWSPSTDAETANPRGLSYNLRLGTNSGGAQILSPQSDLATGARRVPNFGNASQTNFWRVAGLTNGTYYWSVQAIDGAFAGSPFAAEGTFALSRPVISAISNRTTLPNTAIGPINFTVSDAETAASNLIVTVSSSDTNVVPAAGLALAGADTDRSLTITPAANRSGKATLSISAVDGSGQGATRTFLLTVERFADIGAGLTLSGPVAWGDYDNDGYLDLARGATIYRNQGNGTFTNIAAALTGTPASYVAWGDSDGDGDLDLMLGSRVYRNDGGGVFVDMAALVSTASAMGVPGWGDFNNDGKLDLTYPYANGTYLYRNAGNNTFTNLSAGLPYVAQGAVAWGDYDKDGDLDILLAGNGILRVYRNNGNGTFSDLGAGLPGIYSASVAWGDFDNDGFPDFVVAGSTNNAVSGVATRIYRSTTNVAGAGRVFTNLYPVAAQGPPGVWKGTVVWGDLDNDGDLDLLITGETTNAAVLTRVYRNDNGNFVDSGHALPGLKNSFAAWGDFDHDGNLDLALSGNDASSASVSRIYRNYPSGASNSPPNAPTGLAVSVVGKSARLSWTAPADANQPGGLSYNLRLGTAPGAGNIVSPMAETNGLRRVAALGNANERLAWTITNLTGGTFYWSVQAVDHSWAGSAFAAENSFFVSNRPPSAITRSLATTEDTALALTLTGTDPDNDPLTFSLAGQPLFGLVTGTPPNVTYRPATNYFGFDQFTFRANDRTTDSPPAAVFIQVTPVQDLSETSLGIQPTAGGQFQLTLHGEPWQSYRLEASQDLTHWVPLRDFISTNLLMDLIDADAPFYDHRFYRAALVQAVPSFGPSVAADPAGFHLSIAGEPGRNYQVQTSSNLFNWVILTNVLATNSLMPFVDRDVQRFDRKFYRIVAP